MGKEYRSTSFGERGWGVVNRMNAILYEPDATGEPMSQAEAEDLAWAFNRGADTDDLAMKLILIRYQDMPTPKRPEWLIKHMLMFDIGDARELLECRELGLYWMAYQIVDGKLV